MAPECLRRMQLSEVGWQSIARSTSCDAVCSVSELPIVYRYWQDTVLAAGCQRVLYLSTYCLYFERLSLHVAIYSASNFIAILSLSTIHCYCCRHPLAKPPPVHFRPYPLPLRANVLYE